ncbi:MAG: hypothetical protein R3B47_06425 [Bacteroidia bacterium]
MQFLSVILAMRTVIIQGSSSSTGNTHTIATRLQAQLHCDIIDSMISSSGQHDFYAYKESGRYLLPLMRRIVHDYDLLIFATPVDSIQ